MEMLKIGLLKQEGTDMFWNAKNGCVSLGDTEMDYISFGTGRENLIMLPGLGDGLTTVKGMALPMAMTYRMFAGDYKVFVFSRKNGLTKGYSTRDMARDQAEAMKRLGLKRAKVMGISQGGMIAQYLAADYPDFVEKLVLAVTLSRQNEMVQKTVRNWIRLAEQGNYKELMIDTAEKSYSEHYLKKYRLLYPVIGKIGKPKDFSRFIVQAASCTGHDAYAELEKIVCPVLIIGGEDDRIVGADASYEMAEKIKGSRLHVYRGLGHALYEEAKDFNSRVQKFLG